MHKKQKINKYKFCFHSDCLSETLSFSAGSLVKFPCDTLAGINFVLCLFVDCLRAQTTLHTKRNIKNKTCNQTTTVMMSYIIAKSWNKC